MVHWGSRWKKGTWFGEGNTSKKDDDTESREVEIG